MKTRSLSFIFLLCFSLVAALSLSSIPAAHATTFTYTLKGSYDEQGLYAGAINVTIYRTNNSSSTFSLAGTTVLTESAQALAFRFDLGSNQSRVYYCTNATSETIYVIVPTSPYYTYSFTVINYLGVEHGFLESLININGTNRVVERWSIDVLNTALPFTLSWGQAYSLALVCDSGVYYYPDFVAGATTTATFTVTTEMFPPIPSDLRDITVTAQRVNVTWIQSVYTDAASQTNWIYMAVSELGNATAIASTNVTASTLTWNWYGGDVDTNYYVRIIADHQVRGQLTWVRVVATYTTPTNPWLGLDTILGTSSHFPILPSQLVSYAIILITFAAFSWKNAGVGLVVGNLTADFLTLIGWTGFTWSWLGISMTIAILVAIGLQKDRESSYQ